MGFREKVEDRYDEFFNNLDIDPSTGRFEAAENGKGLKFETFPFIGSKYGEEVQILFVGSDVGKVEEPDNGIQSFKRRRNTFEVPPKEFLENNPNNSHIPGTYFSALYFLKDQFRDTWKNVEDNSFSSFRKAMHEIDLPDENPLSYVALTNLWKFVDPEDDDGRGGEKDIKYHAEDQIELLSKEIEILEPDIVIFQGSSFDKLLILQNSVDYDVYVAPHPSWSKAGGPNEYLKQMNPDPR